MAGGEQRNMVEKTFALLDLAAFAWCDIGKRLLLFPGVRRGKMIHKIAEVGIPVPGHGSWTVDPVPYPQLSDEQLAGSVTLLVPAEFDINQFKSIDGFQTARGAIDGTRPLSQPLTRRQLYVLVWILTLDEVVDFISSSEDNVVATCVRFNIPRPATGELVKKVFAGPTPLPPGEDEVVLQIRIDRDVDGLLGAIFKAADFYTAFSTRLGSVRQERIAALDEIGRKGVAKALQTSQDPHARAERRDKQYATRIASADHEERIFTFHELFAMANCMPSEALGPYFGRMRGQSIADRFKAVRVPTPTNLHTQRRNAGRPIPYPKFSQAQLQRKIKFAVPRNFDDLGLQQSESYMAVFDAIGDFPVTQPMTRRELFLLVWSLPWNEVCEAVVWDTLKLQRVCKEFNIPRPLSQHWRQQEAVRDEAFCDLPPGPDLEVLPGVPLELDVVALLVPDGRWMSLHDAFELRHELLRERSRVVHAIQVKKYADSIRGVPKMRRHADPQAFVRGLVDNCAMGRIAATLIVDWYAADYTAAGSHPPNVMQKGLTILGVKPSTDWQSLRSAVMELQVWVFANRLLELGEDEETVAQIAFGFAELKHHIEGSAGRLQSIMDQLLAQTPAKDCVVGSDQIVEASIADGVRDGPPPAAGGALASDRHGGAIGAEASKATEARRLVGKMKDYVGKRDGTFYRDLCLFELIAHAEVSMSAAVSLKLTADGLDQAVGTVRMPRKKDRVAIALSAHFVEAARAHLATTSAGDTGSFFSGQKEGEEHIQPESGYRLMKAWQKRLSGTTS